MEPDDVSPVTKSCTFTLFVHGADVLSDESMDPLFEAGCDDATFGARDGAHYGAFDREATSFSAALASAIRDLTGALPNLEIEAMLTVRELRAASAAIRRPSVAGSARAASASSTSAASD
jgi:hypothetical protein